MTDRIYPPQKKGMKTELNIIECAEGYALELMTKYFEKCCYEVAGEGKQQVELINCNK